MKVLYISGWHSTLEHDELNVLTHLGHTWFSTGLYADPDNPIKEGYWRESELTQKVDTKVLSEFRKLNPDLKPYKPLNLSKEFVDQFDLVMVVYCGLLDMEFFNVWPHIKHKPVIWRTYAQQSPKNEQMVSSLVDKGNVTIVRVSETETRLPNSAGMDFAVMGYVDENKYKKWSGSKHNVLTFNNFFSRRSYVSNTPLYRRIRTRMHDYSFSLYGGYNEDVDICLGRLDSNEQVKAYKDCGVYFALGSKPAALTYNLQEATMTGCPIVTFGEKLGSSRPSLYAVPDMFENGTEMFMGDTEEELVFFIKTLLDTPDVAKAMSKAVRKKALELYSKESIIKQWGEVIDCAVE